MRVIRLCVRGALGLLFCAGFGVAAKAQTTNTRLSPAKIAVLRKTLAVDLRSQLTLAEGKSPSPTEVRELLERCQPQAPNVPYQECYFRLVHLGLLGDAIEVVDRATALGSGNGGPGLDNIYLFHNGSYRLLIGGAGELSLAGESDGVPNVLESWGGGVCFGSETEFRYQNGHYQRYACNRAVQQKGSCSITSCGNGLPTFPAHWWAPDSQ